MHDGGFEIRLLVASLKGEGHLIGGVLQKQFRDGEARPFGRQVAALL